MANNNNGKNNWGKTHNNGNTKTQNNLFKSTSSITRTEYNNQTNPMEMYAFQNIVDNISNLSNKIEKLESENKKINNELSNIKTKENRLLNRFSWTLIMANTLLGVLAFVTLLGYFQFVYPTLQININNDGVFEFLKWIVFGIIGLLAGIWWSVMKFAKYVKDRDQADNKAE